jgi:hypothetical protein
MGGMKFTIRDLLWLTVVAALLIALFVVLPARQAHWEYKIRTNIGEGDLNRLGDEGWDLAAIKSDRGGAAQFYLKRPKSK